MTQGHSVLIVRENQAFDQPAYQEHEGVRWIIDVYYRRFAHTHLPKRYVVSLVHEALSNPNKPDALILFQEEMPARLVQEIFAEFRKHLPKVPILLLRRDTLRGKNLDWARCEQPSAVIDFTERPAELFKTLNQLLGLRGPERVSLTQ